MSVVERWTEFREKRPAAAMGVAAGLLVVALGLLVLALTSLRKPADSALPAGGTEWVCDNGHHFKMTSQQLDEHYAKQKGQPVACPTCGAPAHPEHARTPGAQPQPAGSRATP